MLRNSRPNRPKHAPVDISSDAPPIQRPRQDDPRPVKIDAPKGGRFVDLATIEVTSDRPVKLFDRGEGRQEVRIFADGLEDLLIGGPNVARDRGMRVLGSTGWIESTAPDAELWAIAADVDTTVNVRRQVVMTK